MTDIADKAINQNNVGELLTEGIGDNCLENALMFSRMRDPIKVKRLNNLWHRRTEIINRVASKEPETSLLHTEKRKTENINSLWKWHRMSIGFWHRNENYGSGGESKAWHS